MKSVKYLKAVRDKYQLNTDGEVANLLGISRAAVNHYMTGRRVMDENTVGAVALALNLTEHEAMLMVAAVGMDRAEKEGKTSPWEVFMNRGAAIAASVLMATSVNLFLTPQNAEARTSSPTSTQSAKQIYIMSKPIST